ncbi:MAG: class I SAM-dependent methyltransferase [Enhygromyxa sp.]
MSERSSAGVEAISAVRRIYREIDGFEIPRKDERAVERSRSSATYGELMPTATVRLLEQLGLTRRDVFYDLGAGVGKVVLLAALTTPVAHAVGVELASRRVAAGQLALARARVQRIPGARRATLIEGDMLRCPIDDATVVYTCSTAFPEAFMGRLLRRLTCLPKLRLLASLQDFDEPRGFELIAAPRLDASWKRRTRVHIYARR